MDKHSTDLTEVAGLFLRLGATAFGGPAAHIAMMEDEVVHRRHWLMREEFLDLLGATNLIPGPNSTEMAVHIGHRRAGWPGLLVAGSCFILPAAFIVGVLSWAYVRYGSLPQAEGILHGVKPVVLAIVVQAIWRLARPALKTRLLLAMAAAALLLGLLGFDELLILFGAGAALAFRRAASKGSAGAAGIMSAFLPGLPIAATAGAATASAPFSLLSLFLYFAKIGSVLFGSGYVLLAFLRADLVDRLHWLSEEQLLDAIAIGQVTPGPVFTTATFIGYLLSGVPGAMLATVGIFLPAFFFVAVSGPLVPRLRRSRIAAAFLDGVNAASLALMAVVTIQLAGAAFVDYATVAIGIAAAVLLIRYRLNSTWLVLGGAIVGMVLRMIGLPEWLRI